MVKTWLGIAAAVLVLSGASACGAERGQETGDNDNGVSTSWNGAGRGDDDSEGGEEQNADGNADAGTEENSESDVLTERENSQDAENESDVATGQEDEPDVSSEPEDGSNVLGQENEPDVYEEDQIPLDTDGQIEEAARSLKYGMLTLGERIYEMRKSVADAADFCGQWHRTNIHTGLDGQLAITDQTGERFSFEMDCCYFFHTGFLSGEAWLVTPNVAVAKIDDDFSGDAQYVAFVYSDGVLTVYATGTDWELGLGNRVSVTGEYGIGEPVYTNAGQFDEYFAGEVDAFMREKLSGNGNGYGEYFYFPAEWGYLNDNAAMLADGIRARYLIVYMPTAGSYEFEILVTEDGRIYANLNPAIGFLTNDDSAEAMPEWTYAE